MRKIMYIVIGMVFLISYSGFSKESLVNAPNIINPFGLDNLPQLPSGYVKKYEESDLIDIYYNNWKNIGGVRIRIIFIDKPKSNIGTIDLWPVDLRNECFNCVDGYPKGCKQLDYDYNYRLFNIIRNEIEKQYGKVFKNHMIEHYDGEKSDKREIGLEWQNKYELITLALYKNLNVGCGYAWEVHLTTKKLKQ